MCTLASLQSLASTSNSSSSSSSSIFHRLPPPASSATPRLISTKTLVLADHDKLKLNNHYGNRLWVSPRSRLSALHSQNRPENNVTEDTDDMFDELFEKYGEVVYRSKDQKPASAEADDDAESLSFAMALAKVASDVKAGDIRVLFVKPLVYWTRFFIIATAFSRPQVDAIGSRMRDLAEKQYKKVATGDMKPNTWTLLDFGDVVVHIFLPPERTHYNLEEFYANATSIELPFENQPFRG